MKKINNLKELREERLRLRLEVKRLEQQILEDVELIKNDLKPGNLVSGFFKNMFHRENNGIATAGVNIGIDILLRNLLLRKSGWMYRLLIPYLAKNVANNYMASKNINIVEIGKYLYDKWKNRDHHALYDKGTADINY